MRVIAILAGVLVFGLLGWWLVRSSAEYPITNTPLSGTKVVAFGDSLVEGVGSPNGGFVTALSERLQTELDGPIVNLGKAGDTTAEALARIAAVQQVDPDVVMILLGGNDAIRRVPSEEVFQNLRTIITSLQAEGAAVIVLGIRGGLSNAAYQREFPNLARETGAEYVPDVLDGIMGERELMFDTIHPNQAGYELIADRIEPVLSALLRTCAACN